MATRTRQRSMKEFFAPAAFDPSQSLMKAARRAGRTQSGNSQPTTQPQSQPPTQSESQASTSNTMDAGEESEDLILLSPRSKKMKGKGVKRSQSPSTSGDEADGERNMAVNSDIYYPRENSRGGCPRETFRPARLFSPAPRAFLWP